LNEAIIQYQAMHRPPQPQAQPQVEKD
jgi:hypothetical protein